MSVSASPQKRQNGDSPACPTSILTLIQSRATAPRYGPKALDPADFQGVEPSATGSNARRAAIRCWRLSGTRTASSQ